VNCDDTHVRRESRNLLVNDELGRIALISRLFFFFLVGRNNRARLEQRIYVKDNPRMGMFAEALSIHARASRFMSLSPINSCGCIYSVFISLKKSSIFIMIYADVSFEMSKTIP